MGSFGNRPLIALGSGNAGDVDLIYTAPEEVVEAVREVVRDLRK